VKKGIRITVSEPCAQQWQDLTPQEGGRFCGSCQKLVVDFTRMSDQELLRYFKDHSGKVCGSFTGLQTDRDIISREKPKKAFGIYSLAASFMGILISFTSKAQTADTLSAKPLVEISPVAPKPVTVITQSAVPTAEPLADTFLSPLQGKMGGVCVRPVMIEEKKSFINRVYTQIGDMLREF
jgi:hypothetical protein